jgi:hypothetical protein
MSFHPIGRFIVKLMLPFGLGILDLIGTGFFILFLWAIISPLDMIKRRQAANKAPITEQLQKDGDAYAFIYELVKADPDGEFVPTFMRVVETGNRHNKRALVDKFVGYYGKQTISFIDSRNELTNGHIKSEAAAGAICNITNALDDIIRICNVFISKLIEDDLSVISADIRVLEQMSNIHSLTDKKGMIF